VTPERISGTDPCDLAVTWGLDVTFASKLAVAVAQYEEQTRGTVFITSGFRTKQSQDRLRRQGRPTADDDRSTHRSCPATGADVMLGFAPVRVQKHIWGNVLFLNGLRWGGGSPMDENGIPTDWQHVDMGPRRT